MDADDDIAKAAMASNKLFWEENVATHLASAFYDVDGFRRGRNTLKPMELTELDDVTGRRIAHLQCHFGMDTLSLARMGAEIVGLDYSANAVRAARTLATEVDVAAAFVESNVYDARLALEGDFDLVYTSWGVLSWLPDLTRWARVAASLLKPGGRFYLAECHPATHWFDDECDGDQPLRVRYPWRNDGGPETYDDGGSYADRDADIENSVEMFFRHGLGEIVTAALQAGLVLEFLHEHDALCWQGLPHLVEGGDLQWRLPEGRAGIPLSFTLSARKPLT